MIEARLDVALTSLSGGPAAVSSAVLMVQPLPWAAATDLGGS